MASPLPRFNNHDLERTKIQLEIDRLRRPWYRNLDFYKTLIPSLAAILTVLFAFFSGFLDKRKLELEIDKKQLIYDISTFTHTRDSLYDAYNEKVGELNQTVQELHSVELRLEDISWSLLAAKDSVRDARDQLSRLQASSTANLRESNLKRFKSEVDVINSLLTLWYTRITDSVYTKHMMYLADPRHYTSVDDTTTFNSEYNALSDSIYQSIEEHILRQLLSQRNAYVEAHVGKALKDVPYIRLHSMSPFKPFIHDAKDFQLDFLEVFKGADSVQLKVSVFMAVYD